MPNMKYFLFAASLSSAAYLLGLQLKSRVRRFRRHPQRKWRAGINDAVVTIT